MFTCNDRNQTVSINSVKITVFVATMTHFLFSRSFNFDDIKYNFNCMHIYTETQDVFCS